MNAIIARGIRVHNLKNIDVTIPHRRLIVVTGVSGSGKSSLAFDTLYAEGQRRYVESMSSYARQFLERMEKPDVDHISGMLPAIAIESKNVISNARSTVGTQTELNDFLRLLFARVGQTFCRSCGEMVRREPPAEAVKDIEKQFAGKTILIAFDIPLDVRARKYLKEALGELSKQGFTRLYMDGKVKETGELRVSSLHKETKITVVADRISINPESRARLVDSVESAYRHGRGQVRVISPGIAEQRYSEHFHCSRCDLPYQEPSAHMFSFNSPIGACPDCQGFGRIITIDPVLVVPDPAKSLAEGAIDPWTKPSAHWESFQMKKFCQKKGIPLNRPWKALSEKHRQIIFNGAEGYFGVNEFFEYLEKKTYKMHVRVFLAKYRNYETCTRCNGLRLKADALLVKIGGRNLAELCALTVHELRAFFSNIDLTATERETARSILFEIGNRLEFLDEVGLGYLTLDRSSRTLSGGEAQRIHLATSLGSALVDTLYVLDEPSIGLHERDNLLLIRLLRKLRDLGNTVVVVEHDQAMIRSGDEVIDLGIGAGTHGGEMIFHGSIEDLLKDRRSRTAAYLTGREVISFRSNGRAKSARFSISIEGAREHNLKGIHATIPLGAFCVLTGVSGSGKSTLLYDVLYKNYLRFKGMPAKEVGRVDRIKGFERIDDVQLIDQSPIGRTPRSNPATYIGVFDEVRKVFARTREARLKKMTPGSFSFNVDGGRCPACKGDGKIKVEMHFLADVFIACTRCNGTRYQEHVLRIFHRGKNVHQVLDMTVEDAVSLFSDNEAITGRLGVLKSVGLGYIRLGQAAHTLSAGEAQRLKLALELMEQPGKNLLYLLDEPTTGLHYDDIRHLMSAFERLLEAGHSILMIEHNMEVIKCADWIIDLGPEAGEAGGQVIGCGTPKEIAAIPGSYTGQYLKSYLGT